jgi:hypothetical protein
MRIAHVVRPMLFVLLAAGAPCLTGCRVYYPSVSVVPPPAFQETTDDIHAFRVNDDFDGSSLISYFARGHETLAELSPAEMWLPQVRLSVNSKYYNDVAGVKVLGMEWDSWHSIYVRVYRPGWRIVDLQSWDLFPTVTWVKAESLHEQEEVLDNLMSRTSPNPFREHYIQPTEEADESQKFEFDLARGSTSAAHRSALLFGASEYTRLAALARRDQVDQAILARLLKKAEMLRELADQ